ncbi:hypothetical protein [Paenibacillus sp. MDMC362]|uniref:hypothetical protein n=1 Tax=Paenibacillus sp. MDMC362 TaxID=2977365 RepID=UPI0035948626
MTHFSKGMLQKTNLMQAMIETPDVLVLDEPFSGLDKKSTGHLLSSDPLLAGQLESRAYWIRQGRILMDNVDNSSDHSTAFFELEGSVDQETWKTYDNGYLLFTIMKKDYRGLLIEFIHKGGEFNSLCAKST